MNWTGLIAAIGTFLLIGSFHVIVIKTEYYFGKQVWPVFAGGRDFFPARLSPDLKYDHQRADRCFRDHLHLEHQGII